MRTKISTLLALGIISTPIFLCAAEHPVEQLRITVFSTHNYPFNVTKSSLPVAAIYYLDEAENIENQLSANFSKNPAVALKQAQQLMQSPKWSQYEQQLQNAYQGVAVGWENGIKKVPAVLFEMPGYPTSVIYGSTNLKQAYSLWLNWFKTQSPTQGESQ